jgi:hypothetical protein
MHLKQRMRKTKHIYTLLIKNCGLKYSYIKDIRKN